MVKRSARVYRVPSLVLACTTLILAFNHPQYGFPSNSLANTNFGVITSLATLYSPRNILVSLRYQY